MPAGEKPQLRRTVRADRDALAPAVRTARGAAIAERLLALPEVRRARLVAAYATYGSEVPTEGIIAALRSAGVRIALPLTGPDGTLRFIIVQDLAALRPGAFGVREPEAGESVPAAAFDLALVPGIAFDADGCRVGYGKGCYDRWLEGIPLERRVALAFDLQVVAAAPRCPHDVPVGTIVTETRTIRCHRKEIP